MCGHTRSLLWSQVAVLLIFQRCLVYIPGQGFLPACAAILKINVCMTPEPSHFLAKCLFFTPSPGLARSWRQQKIFLQLPLPCFFALCKVSGLEFFNKLILLWGTVTEISVWFPLCEWGLNGVVKPDVGLHLRGSRAQSMPAQHRVSLAVGWQCWAHKQWPTEIHFQ